MVVERQRVPVSEYTGRGVIMLRKTMLRLLPQLGSLQKWISYLYAKAKKLHRKIDEVIAKDPGGPSGRELACNEIWSCGLGLGACILVHSIRHNDAVQVRNL
jgi:hypothetical protein